ncbi:glycogen debranching protein GlgX [Nakamurella aerolata]|uniref:Glycogen debranching protein GlgX n=1 Tax=Nakamurella aerolata TaxID=1656892 RepID=A0A849ACF1_9ACTN|nr:glycogen debranching protein GlgX [Nakamurella aerolata]NNG34552.1 glycogen debranching protein GlgX [Nakamurella aerolata]
MLRSSATEPAPEPANDPADDPASRAGRTGVDGGADGPAGALPAVSAFPGRPYPLGATVQDGGTNFAVVADSTGRAGAADAAGSGVQLCLIDADGTERRWAMTDNTRGIWHAFVPGVGPGQRYGYRVAAHDPAKLLLDPYARRVDSTEYDLLAASQPGADTGGKAPLGIVTAPVTELTMRPDRPPRPEIPWEHTVVYEAHVKGMTATHPGIPAQLRGTFAGLAHPATIDYLRELGVTAVELLPVQAAASEPGLVATGRRNYWGYSTLAFFAPDPRFASRPGAELAEFVAMVDALHAAGIEVLLDVVYNHTAEGGPEVPITLSERGFAPGEYYLPPGTDLTGCGNTLNAGTLTTVRLVTDSLRYWADVGVDGFRFDLASVLGRPGGGGFEAGSALLTAIAADPVLAGRKLIAEPWDATAEGYAVGRFGQDWAEWNDKFRDDVRDFWRGQGSIAALARRLTGSQDLFGDGRRPFASVNFVTAHDGFTLRDLVSYNNKHNDANGENNRDGTDNNRSDNNGVEGDTDDPAVLQRRLQQARNLMATLLLATGTPMVTMGDERWRTQRGNNNPYCLDTDVSWMDWAGSAEQHQLQAFFTRTLGLRKNAAALHQGRFFSGAPGGPSLPDPMLPDLMWFGPDGRPMAESDWLDPQRRTLGMWVNGATIAGHGPHGEPLSDDSWLLIINGAEQPTSVTLPDSAYGASYLPVLDTTADDGAPGDPQPLPAGQQLTVAGRTVLLLRVAAAATA